MTEIKYVTSPYVRGPRLVHSNRLRAFLARFFAIKPNKLIPGDTFIMPDGSVMIDYETYSKMMIYKPQGQK